MAKDVFKTLNAINVNDHTEKKKSGGFRKESRRFGRIKQILHEQLEQVAHAQAAEVADGSAQNAHQNTDTGVGLMVCNGNDGSDGVWNEVHRGQNTPKWGERKFPIRAYRHSLHGRYPIGA